jgi:hypothetical protein
MYESIVFKLKPISPILLHNGQLSNPLNEFSKAMKEVTAKKKKTDGDHKLLSDLEWLGSLYVTDQVLFEVKGYEVVIVGGGKLCIPGENLEGMLISAAKKQKEGVAFKSGILVDGDFPLSYNGPKSIAELFQKPGFRDIRRVKVGQAAIMRTRPIVRDWSAEVTVQYLPDIVNRKTVIKAMEDAGKVIGLGDYRPKFGRFLAEVA